MAIQEIVDSGSAPSITKRCDNCGSVESIDAASLLLGTASSPEHIDLPPCGTCGARATLIRTTDATVPARLSSHRRTVNALANYLRSAGKIAASAMSYYADPKTPAAAPVGALYGKVR